MRRLRTLSLTLLLVLAACAEAGSNDEVRSFDEIAVAGPDVEVDPSGTLAVLTVETSIDAICAVAFGVGEPDGRIATDQDMDAGGHSLHRVTMDGLDPDTEYRYRLQGVGADGALYRSEVLTFRTPPAAESAFGVNVAVGAGVSEVSSEFSGAFAASNAVDGDLSTEWSSRGDGSDAFITVDLGAETHVGAVAFRTREMADGTAVTTSFTVTVDGGAVHGPFAAGSDPVRVDFTGRVLRFDVEDSTGGNTGAVEIEVYPASDSG